MTEFKEDFDDSECVHKMPKKFEGRMFIYVLMDEDENILYVGKSILPQARVWAERVKKSFVKYKYFECDPDKVSEIQLKLYEKYNPPLNKTPPLDPNYCGMDNFKSKNKELMGKIKKIRSYLSENPVETRGGMYPIKYLKRLKREVTQ